MTKQNLSPQEMEIRMTNVEEGFVSLGLIVKKLVDDFHKVVPSDPEVEAWFEKNL